LIDTGPIVALYSENDPDHRRCRASLVNFRPPLLTCWPVLTETAWLLRKRPDGFQAITAGFSSGFFALSPLDGNDLAAIATIMRRYESAGVQLADAALVHLADREGIRTLFTTDRRDFSIIRLKRNRMLKIIPEVQ
jgi:predicted nucleic acid-binding protein